MSKKSVIFVGDSFTWGEGLELYTPTPKWIAEREIDNSTWVNSLMLKQDSEGTEFRDNNRFPYLACKELNYDFFVDSENGGTIARNLFIIEKNIVQNNITDIVLQFSSYNREPLHLSHECRCDYCQTTHCSSILHTGVSYLHKQNKLVGGDITEKEKYTIKFVSEKIGISDATSLEFVEKMDEYCRNEFDNQLTLLNQGFFHRLRSIYNINIYYIDSWCKTTSNIIQNNQHISPFIIPLIGKTNRSYRKWEDWLQTFDNKSIADEFPKTGNHHPTLEMHQYLAKSVINHFKKFEKTVI